MCKKKNINGPHKDLTHSSMAVVKHNTAERQISVALYIYNFKMVYLSRRVLAAEIGPNHRLFQRPVSQSS